jgi:hypothetical protein
MEQAVVDPLGRHFLVMGHMVVNGTPLMVVVVAAVVVAVILHHKLCVVERAVFTAAAVVAAVIMTFQVRTGAMVRKALSSLFIHPRVPPLLVYFCRPSLKAGYERIPGSWGRISIFIHPK